MSKKWKKNSKNAGPKQTAAHKSDNGKPDISYYLEG
jgi:hypothetical protein